MGKKPLIISFDEDSFVKFVKQRNMAVMAGENTFDYDGYCIKTEQADVIIEKLANQFDNVVFQKSYFSKN